jgi:uncharacterized protein with GYD domain
MPKYISLINYTDEGVKTFKDFAERLANARRGADELGVTLDAYYLTIGRFDAVVIIDAPDNRTAAKVALVNAANGRVRTETLVAFTEAETATLADELPA